MRLEVWFSQDWTIIKYTSEHHIQFVDKTLFAFNLLTAAAANVRHVMGAEQRAAAATERPTLFFPDLHNIHFLVYGGKVLNVYSR